MTISILCVKNYCKIQSIMKQSSNSNVQKCMTMPSEGSRVAKRLFAMVWLVCLNMLVAGSLFAQQGTIAIKGKITSAADREALIGATVLIKGSGVGTAADINGEFTLDAAPDAVLVITCIGFQQQEIAVKGRTALDIVMQPETISLEDVVVIGYGTQKKVNLTGAVASISSKELAGKPVANVVEALQGTTPGLVIQQSNSQPGMRPSINIRGLNTLNNNDPMVIIDGIIGDIQNVNPSDIESMSVLKDASSTAIYGSRASNGVILITTKKGSANKTEINYQFMYGWQDPTCLPKIVDSWIYAELRNEALVNSGRPTAFTPEQIDYYRHGGPNVKWIEELYKKATPQQSHSLSLTGGNDRTTYLLSMGYMDQGSMFKGPNYGLKRYNARLNLHHKMYENLTIDATIAYARNEIKDHAYWTEWLIEQANRMPSIYEIKDKDGNYMFPSGSNSNALARLERGGYRKSMNDDLSATLSAELHIWDGLKLKGMVGGQLYNNRMHENRKAIDIPGSGDTENRMTENFGRTQNITTNLMLTYDKTFGKHTVGAMVGYSYEGSRDNSFQTYRLNDAPNYDIMAGAQTTGTGNEGWASDWAIYSVFARLNYNYEGRYLFEANLRDDMSSKFAKGNRSALFPSFSLGWRISEEKFFEGIRDYIPSLKLRGSWGLVGNNRIDNYQYLSTISVAPGYNFGNNVVNTAGYGSANADMKWETTRMANVGVDLGLLDNALNVSADFFHNMTRDILIALPVPGIYGGGAPIQNAGKVKNYGWEIAASYRFKTGGIEHTISGNISDSYNEVVDTKGVEWINGYDVNTIIKEGYPINSYYAYRWDGFFQNEAEVAKGPHLDGITPKPGDIRYIDKSGPGGKRDGVIKEDDDRFILGNNFPHYTYGFSYGFSWKGFDFSMFWQGVGKRSVWLRGEAVEAFHNNNEGPVLDFHQDRWTPSNPNATYPRLTVGSESANNAAKSDFWIQDGSYLRLKNLQLGYTFPAKWLRKACIKDLKVYVSGQNLFTHSHIKGGWDPETTDGGGRIYPVSRVISCGLNVKF